MTMRWLLAVVGVAIGVAIGAVVWMGDEPADESPAPIETDLVEVIRTDLVERRTLDGFLRFADAVTVVAQRAGTVTSLPLPATRVGFGDVLYEIDGRPVVLMRGARPAWRPLSDGVDEGPDVEQLETGLIELGYEPGEADGIFDADTSAAVEAWQEDLGVEPSGVVALGDVWFSTAPLRIAQAVGVVGAPSVPGSPVVDATGDTQEVVIDLDPGDLDLVEEGEPALVTLPDGSELEGRVAEIGSTVRRIGPDPEGPEVIEVIVEISAADSDLERAPVDVEIESSRAAAVLAVPVRALITLSDGGYAVEVDVDGARRLVGVSIGDFADGLVEVEGAVDSGDLVVVPVG